MGIFDFLSGGGSGGQSWSQSSSTQTQKSEPWWGIAPYLTGGPDAPGIFPEAGRLYNFGNNFTPAMRGFQQDWANDLTNRRNLFNAPGLMQNMPNRLLEGQFDPRISAAGAINGPASIDPTDVSAVSARASQGALDPTNALYGYLNDTRTNPWIGQQGQAITSQLTRNTLENVLPQIRHDAIANGQYGGSRDALATGLALSRLNQDIAPALTSLAGSSWENAQDRGLSTGLALNQQAVDIATGNANRKLQADTTNAGNLLDVQKFNTGTALANNAQEMQRAAQAVANRGAGLNFATGAAGLQNQTYGDLLKALNLPTDYDWGQLAKYAGIIQPSAGLFPTTTTTGSSSTVGQRPSRSNDFAGLLGAALGVLEQSGLLGL
jgi:hypothetical protein